MELRTIGPEELKEIREKHERLLRGEPGGQRADLRGANLDGADLSRIREDLYAVLGSAPNEVPALLQALRDGRVDGSTYEGDCACLVGTIAKARGCYYNEVSGLPPDSSRPAERWFLAIRKGDRPADNQVAAITERWIAEWVAARDAVLLAREDR